MLAGLVGVASLAVLATAMTPDAMARGRHRRGSDDVRVNRVFEDHGRHSSFDDGVRREDRRLNRREDRRIDRRVDRRLDRRLDRRFEVERHGVHGVNHR